MESLGYITLQEAAKRSGKTVEALKKQCQTGRIRGAIKQSKTWFVPASEVLVSPSQPDDAVLHILLTMTEATGKVEGASGGFYVTLYLKGTVLTGRLIPRKVYLEKIYENFKSAITFPGSDDLDEEKEKDTYGVVKKYLDSVHERNEHSPIKFIHLDEVTLVSGSDFSVHQNELLRIKLASIDGFALGRLEKN